MTVERIIELDSLINSLLKVFKLELTLILVTEEDSL